MAAFVPIEARAAAPRRPPGFALWQFAGLPGQPYLPGPMWHALGAMRFIIAVTRPRVDGQPGGTRRWTMH